MMTVINCIAYEHNFWLVLLAAAMCILGASVTVELFRRSLTTRGGQRVGWHFLTAVAAGSAIWATHFIAMLGYEPDVPISFDPVLTILSLLIAIAGCFAGFSLAANARGKVLSFLGGGVVGLAVSAMHYTGMFAYRAEGIVEWSQGHIIASIVLAVVLSGASLLCLREFDHRSGRLAAMGLLVFGIVSLHFTGMAAFSVTPMDESVVATNAAAMFALALSIALVAMLIVGAALSSYLIDRSLRSASFERLRHMALHDTLTGLPNRAAFSERLAHEMEIARVRDYRLALIGLDLDRFKEINDMWGHSAGDEVLRELAERLKSIAQPDELVARLGGDEFVALKRFRDQPDLDGFTRRLSSVFDRPIELVEANVAGSGSMGIAIFPSDANDAETLISNADLAMYRAKAGHGEKIAFYDGEMGDLVRQQRALAADLRQAIDRDELRVHYQVQTSVADGSTIGYEALLRWEHPERGNIPPADFIPLAEETGLILPLGEWVLRRACRDAAGWKQPHKVAVNLSAVQFTESNLPSLVHAILLETGLTPSRLELELTESALAKDKVRSIHMVRQIKALGVNVALDDFGTGYSSLETLRSFPFDKIKLDRAFMKDAGHDPQSKAIIRAVLALGKSLDIPVLAEGIETEDQLDILRREGCDEAQGYLLGRPMPMSELDGVESDTRDHRQVSIEGVAQPRVA